MFSALADMLRSLAGRAVTPEHRLAAVRQGIGVSCQNWLAVRGRLCPVCDQYSLVAARDTAATPEGPREDFVVTAACPCGFTVRFPGRDRPGREMETLGEAPHRHPSAGASFQLQLGTPLGWEIQFGGRKIGTVGFQGGKWLAYADTSGTAADRGRLSLAAAVVDGATGINLQESDGKTAMNLWMSSVDDALRVGGSRVGAISNPFGVRF